MAVFPSIVPAVRFGGIYAKYAYNIPLILEFGGEAGIPDAQAALIYQAWLDSSADRVPITLSSPLLAGMLPELQERIPSGMLFYFSSEEPSMVDTVPGRKLVRLRLEGRYGARHVA
jgi:hypothetical protein